MKPRAIFSIILLALSTLLASAQSRTASAMKKAAPAPTTQFDRNLIKNPGIEAEGKDSKHVPDWGPVDGLTGVKYGSASGEWDWGLSGCDKCGKRYLRLAFEGGPQELSVSQTVDVNPSAADIEKNVVTASISAYLGGFHNGDETGTLIASFQNASGKELGEIETKPYVPKELPKAEKGSTGLTLCQASGKVPASTKKIVFTGKVVATGKSSDYLGLGDNFSLVLTKLQPPKS
ncbi:MAG: hypothetical protein WAO10_03415 [Candidatus Sulfotelmatobacter sp.]